MYVGAQYTGLYALSTATGEIRWQESTGEHGVWLGSPVLDGDVLCVGGRDAVHGYDVEAGEWRWRTEGEPRSRALVDGLYCFGAHPSGCVALRTSDGTEAWRVETERDAIGPAVASDVLLFCSGARTIAVSTDGREQWEWTVEDAGRGAFPPLFAVPATDGHTGYVPTTTGCVYALDIETGAQRWTNEASEHPMRAWPVVAAGRVYVGDDAGTVYAIDPASGDLMWETSVSSAT